MSQKSYKLGEEEIKKALIAYLILYKKVDLKAGDKFTLKISGSPETFSIDVNVHQQDV